MFKHPGIVPAFEAGAGNVLPYRVFEYVAGETLDRAIKLNGATNTLQLKTQRLGRDFDPAGWDWAGSIADAHLSSKN
jgi:hypothetical protein